MAPPPPKFMGKSCRGGCPCWPARQPALFRPLLINLSKYFLKRSLPTQPKDISIRVREENFGGAVPIQQYIQVKGVGRGVEVGCRIFHTGVPAVKGYLPTPNELLRILPIYYTFFIRIDKVLWCAGNILYNTQRSFYLLSEQKKAHFIYPSP